MVQEIITPGNAQKTDPMEIIAMLLKQNNDLLTENTALRTNGTGTVKAGKAPKTAVRCLDTKTGNVYHSHAAAGMAVAGEYGLKVHNFVWYEVIAKDKTRFQDITDEQYQATLKANAEKQEAKQEVKPVQPTHEHPQLIKPAETTEKSK